MTEAPPGRDGVCAHALHVASFERTFRDYNPSVSGLSSKLASVLVMDDDVAFGDFLNATLREAGYEVRVARNVGQAKALIAQREFDVALLDMHLPDGTGEDVLLRLGDEGALTETIMLTGDRDIANAVQAMKLGASDYLVKPAPLASIELAVAQARERHRLRAENLSLRARPEPGGDGDHDR